MKIKKVLNSSVVLVEHNGLEKIALGKGIGYAQKPGNIIDSNAISQIFQAVDSPQAEKLLTLVEEIPDDYFELTTDIISYAENRIKKSFPPSLYFTLTDHLFFAVERFQKNLVIENKVLWEIKSYYAEEFHIGRYALKKLNDQFHIVLPEGEAANIAFHLINAQQGTDLSIVNRVATLMADIETLLNYSNWITIDKDSIHYQRFMTHLKFFVERFFSGNMLEEEQSLYDQIKRTMPEALSNASSINDFIKKTYQRGISRDELVYLAIHLNRLSQKKD